METPQQETVRLINRTIREFADAPGVDVNAIWEFFCECGCFTLVRMTVADFDAGAGVWAAGHRPHAPV